jgi:hypothetical protein
LVPAGVNRPLEDSRINPPYASPLPALGGTPDPSSHFWWIGGAPRPGSEGSYKFQAVATAKQAGCSPCGPDLTAHVKLSLAVEAEASKLKLEPGSLTILGSAHTPYPGASFRASGSHTGCYAVRPLVGGADPKTGVLGTIDGLQFTTQGVKASLRADWAIDCAYAEEATLELTSPAGGGPEAAGQFPFALEVAEFGCPTPDELCTRTVTRDYKLKVEPGVFGNLGLFTQAGPLPAGEPVGLVEGEMLFDMFDNGEIADALTLDCVEESLRGTMSAPNPSQELRLALTSSSFVGDGLEAQECKVLYQGKINQYLGGRPIITTNQSVSNPWVLSVSGPKAKAYFGRSEAKLTAGRKLAITADFAEADTSCTCESAAMTGFIYPGLAELYVERTKAPGVAASPWKLNTRVSETEFCPSEAEFSGAFALVSNPAGLEPEPLQLLG